MARSDVTLTVEMDLCSDAIAEIARAHTALADRHGAEFRLLERRIEDAADTKNLGDVNLHILADGFVIAEPPSVLKELLGEIKRLGV